MIKERWKAFRELFSLSQATEKLYKLQERVVPQ